MKRYGTVLMCFLLALLTFVLACPAQQTIGALVSVLGNAAASLATIEGKTDYATTLQNDTANAVTQVNTWKTDGSAKDQAVQALQLVVRDIDAIPGLPDKYKPLIVLAAGTAQSILSIIGGPQAQMKASKYPPLVHPPKTDKEFKARWNRTIADHPELSSAPKL